MNSVSSAQATTRVPRLSLKESQLHVVPHSIRENVASGMYTYEDLFNGDATDHLSSEEILDYLVLSKGVLGFDASYGRMGHLYDDSRTESDMMDLIPTHTSPYVPGIKHSTLKVSNNMNDGNPYSWDSHLTWSEIELNMDMSIYRANETNFVVSLKPEFVYDPKSYPIDIARILTEQFSFKTMLVMNGGAVLKRLMSVYSPSYFSTQANL